MRILAPTLRRNAFLQALVLASLMPSLCFYPTSVRANPSGAVVAAGNVQFSGFGTSNLDIMQGSSRAVINWQSFSIAQGETTRFIQPNGGVALNRVVGGNISEIYGSLQANGGVILINPNGVVVGPSGTIDVAGLLALSTLDTSNSEFLNGGPMRFRGSSGAGVVNYGAISSQSGDVVLLGNFLHNHGSVSAPSGTVAFGAGGDILVEQTASGATISVHSGGNDSHIDNTGTVTGAAAEFKAHGNAYSLAVQNSGVVRANGYNFTGGKLTLSGGSQGSVVNTGTLSARNADGSGGRVDVSGGRVTLGGVVDASGEVGRDGGVVSVNASEIQVDQGASIDVGGSQAGRVSLIGEESVALAGRIDAVGSDGAGGQVDLTAASVVLDGTAAIHATGATGGTVRVGGGVSGLDAEIGNAQSAEMRAGSVIIADGTAGDGGRVVLFAEGDTLFEGQISAQALGSLGNGGFVEVSGQQQLSFDGDVSTLAANGRTGTLLIDPIDIVIYGPGGSGTMTDTSVRNMVAANNVILHTSGAGTSQGNITINSGAKIIYDSPNSLTFLANGSIFVNGDIKNIGTTDDGIFNGSGVPNTGHITLVAGWGGTLPSDLLELNDSAYGSPSTISASHFINADGSRRLDSPFGSWGAAGSQVYLNQAGLEAVEVGSARGETNVFADIVQMRQGRASGRFTQIGYRRVADNRANDLGGFGGYFENPEDQIVDGDINVSGLSVVRLLPSDEFSTTHLNKVRELTYVMIGHGGIRRNDTPLVAVDGGVSDGFGYDSGVINVADGDNSGNITVYAGTFLEMMGGQRRGHTQIGHGGQGVGSGTTLSNSGGHTPFTNQFITGDMSGDIHVTAGSISMEAGLYSDVPVQIGHGGYNVRGEHSGNITVTTTMGNIRATAAPNIGGAGGSDPAGSRFTDNRNRSYAMIGHGGVNSFHLDALPARNLVLNTAGNEGVTSFAGDGITINENTGLPYGHSGDITVVSAGGIHMTASGNDAFAKIGHGGLSSHGDHRGDIHVEAKGGSVVFDRIALQVDIHGRDRRNVGVGAFSQIGHGGRNTQGGALGDIYVSSAGNIEFYAGRNLAFAMIGHGGRGRADSATVDTVTSLRDASHAAGTLSGNIEVHAAGDIIFRSGFGTASSEAFAMIGHGGYRKYADILEYAGAEIHANYGLIEGQTPYGGGASRIELNPDYNPNEPDSPANQRYRLVPDETQQGHNGDIVVNAGGNIDFRAGQTEAYAGQEAFGMEQNGRRRNFVMIGHGGFESYGDHWGNIDITAGGDLTLEARGGWDSVSIFSTNTTGLPRLAADEDSSLSGLNHFAMIGHGGHDSGHRLHPDRPGHVSGSGKLSDGMGVWGDSDITINVGGDINLIAPQIANAGPALPVTLALRIDGSTLYYLDGEGVALEQWLADNPSHDDYNDFADQLDAMRIDLRDVTPEEGLAMTQHSGRIHWVPRADGELWVLPDPVVTALDGFVQIGHGGRLTSYRGGTGVFGGEDGFGHRGNITINAGGGIVAQGSDIPIAVGVGQTVEVRAYENGYNPFGDDIRTFQVGPGTPDDDLTGVAQTSGTNQRSASLATRNYIQIGLGGHQARGDHMGNITIFAGRTASGAGLHLLAGEGVNNYAQIGNGGYEAGGYNPHNTGLNSTSGLLDDTGDRGEIHIEVDGDIIVRGGGNLSVPGMTSTSTDHPSGSSAGQVSIQSNNIYSYAQIGNGGALTHGTHSGTITVISNEGDLDLLAGAGRRAVAQIGHGGYSARAVDHNGDIHVVARGDINLRGGIPFIDALTGQISSTERSNAQIGHGGYDSNAQSGTAFNGIGSGGFYGDIEVISIDGSVRLQGGGHPGLTVNASNFTHAVQAQIGHGGYSTHGDHRGTIRLVAGENVEIFGGASGREGFAQVGHGGIQVDGNLSGTIQVIAGNDLIMNRGADTDTGDGDRAGSQLFNNWATIGHGDQRRGHRTDGTGTRNGDIFVSVGNNIILSDPAYRPFADEAYTRAFADQVLIGHIDSRVSFSDPFRSTSGNTFIAVGRNNPFAGGAGRFIAYGDATITSAGEGIFGDLRLYMPDPSANEIAGGVMLNGDNYTRTPAPDGSRSDEQEATEHSFGVGAFGELTAFFLPAGDYPAHPFGFYNLYYGGAAPIIVPPVRPVPPSNGPAFDSSAGFDFARFFDSPLFDSTQYDAYDRYMALLEFDGYGDGLLEGISIEDALDDEGNTRRRRGQRKAGVTPTTFYVYQPGTNQYSSFSVFGVPETRLPSPR